MSHTRAIGAPPTVAVRGVVHRFARARGGSVHVLDGIDLDVPRGSFVSIVGPSGCGKSTLLRMLAGLLRPDHGTIALDGDAVTGPGAAAFQPQGDALLPWRRVLRNATLAAELAGVPRADAERDARRVLHEFGLGEFATAWPAQLSGGMRQRVALVRAHLAPTRLLLLDEPLGALDALTRRDLHVWLQQLHAIHPRTTVLVTHDVDEALTLSDEVVVLTARPARVAGVVACPWPRPRASDVVTSDRFVTAKAALLRLLASPPR